MEDSVLSYQMKHLLVILLPILALYQEQHVAGTTGAQLVKGNGDSRRKPALT